MSDRVQWLTRMATIPLLLISILPTISQSGRPPHIVVVMADDLGWNEVSWRDHRVLTPHMEVSTQYGVLVGAVL